MADRDPVIMVAHALVIESFGGKYALADGWERFKEERPADLGFYLGKARRLVGAVGAALVQASLTGGEPDV